MTMKRLIAITMLAGVAFAPVAFAQSTATTPATKPLAEVAKDEEARRKSVRKPAKVYTNGDLRPDISRGVQPPATAPASTDPSAGATPGNATPTAPGGDVPAAPARDQAYWAGRMKELRTNQERLQIFADSLQSRINALKTDFVNRDDPAQRAKIEADLNASLAELERVKKDLAGQVKAIQALEDEARRAGVPPGWLRSA
jgi:hypothetical protein